MPRQRRSVQRTKNPLTLGMGSVKEYDVTKNGEKLFFRISKWGYDGEIVVEMNKAAAEWFRKHFDNDFEEVAGE